jgi:thioredoxin reductase (NADPH)
MTDIAIIGAGPAGVAAALTARARGKSVYLVSNDPLHSGLAKAERIDNYPGMVGKTGAQVVQGMLDELDSLGIELHEGRVISVLPFGDEFMLGIGQDMVQANAVILALGAAKGTAFPGEQELLGRGVSYCATCDGMLYRDRTVCVVGSTEEAEKEAAFLAGIGCKVTYVSHREPLGDLAEGIEFRKMTKVEIVGEDSVRGLVIDGEEMPCDAVFVLRPAIAPSSLIPGIETEGAFISVDGDMRTNIPGVFAAGDCVGKPLQVAKAVGQGQLAAFAAVEYLDGKRP